jgi:hypothetical protein
MKTKMEKHLAKIVLAASYKSGQELSNIVPLLKEFCPPEEYDRLVSAIGSILHELETGIRQNIFEDHPDLAAEIEERVQKYGRTF